MRTTAKSMKQEQNVILGLSLPLILILIVCSAVGLLFPEIYYKSTPNWLAQTVAQDAIDLFLVSPILIVAALYSFKGFKFAQLMWGGTITYVAYTFTIYCFSVSFNSLFPLYCIVLGLSLYSIAWFILTQFRHSEAVYIEDRAYLRITGTYFILVAVLFYALWLKEVIPAALSNTPPESLIETGLLTNPVQVIDLSVFLPLVFVAGLAAFRPKNKFSYVVIPVILEFFILMDLTIAVITVVMMQRGLEGSLSIAAIMGGLALFSFILLMWFLRIEREELAD